MVFVYMVVTRKEEFSLIYFTMQEDEATAHS